MYQLGTFTRSTTLTLRLETCHATTRNTSLLGLSHLNTGGSKPFSFSLLSSPLLLPSTLYYTIFFPKRCIIHHPYGVGVFANTKSTAAKQIKENRLFCSYLSYSFIYFKKTLLLKKRSKRTHVLYNYHRHSIIVVLFP